ncbi:jg5738 [Pararge aegeria aegeria]|uniref:Jg5738 protein n=1 Tax=Pararge aegeria aegeria TaxID=348720 RepID=A0A8S4SKS6_9NEOP|nr:jg5738 [Pararge aegeria aegeria]
MDVKEELNKKSHADSDALETVLTHVGELGRYQKMLFLGMAPFGIFFAFVYFVQMFITATPQRHWCRVPELEHLDLELRRNLTAPSAGDTWERCLMYDANWTHVLQNNSVPPDTPIVACKNGWEFELGDIPYETVVSERGWVCENAGYTPLAQTIFFVGSFVGGIYFGWMADHFGRVPALVGSNVIAFVGGVASIYTTGIWDFAFCRLLVGMSYDSCFMIMYILAIMARFLINMAYNAAIQWSAELLPTPVRASGTALIHVSGYVATIVSPYIVYSEHVWRSLPLLILGVIAVVGSSVGLLLPETNGMQMPQTIEEGEKIVSSYTLCGKVEEVEVESPEENDKMKALIT